MMVKTPVAPDGVIWIFSTLVGNDVANPTAPKPLAVVPVPHLIINPVGNVIVPGDARVAGNCE